MTQIKKTFDYDLFKKHHSNREISSVNLKRITASIKAQNMLQFRPILVDSEMRVIDGQHRLEAAKDLGVEVYYQIDDSDEPEKIILLNANQKKWGIEDYCNYHISQGNENYEKLRRFCKEKGVNVATAIRSFGRKCGGDTALEFKSGKFKFFDAEEVKFIESMLMKKKVVMEAMLKYILKYDHCIKSVKMESALFALLKNPDFNHLTFISKLAYKADAIRPCADKMGYYNMLRDIYNWKNQNPVS